MSIDSSDLKGGNLVKARKILFTIIELLEQGGIPYHLEGGTLLGIVRDKELLPWDHDVDLSAPQPYAVEILRMKFQLLLRGYKISVRKSKNSIGPIKKNQYSVIKIKPLWDYIAKWFLPHKSFVVADIFLKTSDATHTYWQAQGKVMRVENRFYESFETIEYEDRLLKAPNHYVEFLAEKYGDWRVPVKEWDCGKNELTIFA